MKREEQTSAVTESFRLMGFEKAMLHENIRIAHVLQTSLSPSSSPKVSLKELVSRAPAAWKWVTARHPRMRARVSSETKETTNRTATIYPSLSESALAASLVVMEDKPLTFWKDYVLTECHKTDDMSTKETLFSMTLLPNSQQDKLVLVLFSNHVVSDGFSGYVILRDFLRVLTKQTMDQDDNEYQNPVPMPLPLQKSIFEQVIPRTFFRTLYDKVIAKLGFRMISWILPYITTSLQKVPKISTNQNSTQHFASGSVENLQKALEICRSEETTLMGPICIAIALSIANATDSIQKDTTHIKTVAQVDYNLRNRVGMGKEHVGLNIGIGNPSVFNTPGLALEAPFWETARSLKNDITKAGDDVGFHAMMALGEHIPVHQMYSLAAKAPQGVTNMTDVNISNLGRWPFGDTMGPLSLEEVELFCTKRWPAR